MRFNSKKIVLYCLGLPTQNPGLREVVTRSMNPRLRKVALEPSCKKGSDKINMLKYGKKTTEENKLYHTVWTHIGIPALKR